MEGIILIKKYLIFMFLLLSAYFVNAEWYSATYTSRYNITTPTSSNLAMVINGSNGYNINGLKNLIWYNPYQLTGSRAIYNGSSNIYAVANLTSIGSFDNPRGGLNNTPTTIYGSDAGIVLHFENNGSWIDSTNNNNEGVITAGSPVYINDSVIGGAYNFDGTTKVSFNNNASINKGGSESITFLVWLYFIVDQEQGPFGKKDGSAAGYFMYTGAGGYLQLGMRTDAGTDCNLDKAGAFAVGQWYHVAWVVDDVNTQSRFYINGTSIANVTKASCGGDSSNTDPLRLGTEQNQYGIPFNGVIDEFRIYKRVLTIDEINEDYQNGIGNNNLLSSAEYYNAPTISTGLRLSIGNKALRIMDRVLRI
jgi:hypothetical protein